MPTPSSPLTSAAAPPSDSRFQRAETGLLVAELGGDILTINPAMVALLDLASERAVGANLFELLSPPEQICEVMEALIGIIWNLLSNAVKFSDRGGTVHASLAMQRSQYVLEVRDQGIGIEPAFLPLVFDRFKQADSSTTRRTGGLGLGLSLVRHIVELHGGSVAARSDGPGTGASFTFTLPIQAIASAALPTPPAVGVLAAPPVAVPAADTRSLDGVRVLVVEDEADARDLLATSLTHAGADVRAVASADEAFEALERFAPHVLVSDIGVPGENGYSMLRRLRASGPLACREIPALALTAYARGEDRESARAAGFTAHLGKPVTPDALIAMVATLAGAPVRPA